MSGNIKKLLGPVKKRLSDRVHEAKILIDEGDDTRLEAIRSKVATNLKYHEELTLKLSDVSEVTNEEQALHDATLEQCGSLNMDAMEMIQSLDDRMAKLNAVEKKETKSHVQMLEEEKI